MTLNCDLDPRLLKNDLKIFKHSVDDPLVKSETSLPLHDLVVVVVHNLDPQAWTDNTHKPCHFHLGLKAVLVCDNEVAHSLLKVSRKSQIHENRINLVHFRLE